MQRHLTAFVLTFSLLMMLALRAAASGAVCLPPHDMAAALLRHYGEHPLATALMRDDGLLQVYTSADGSWTMTFERPGGLACIIAAGRDFSLLHRDGLVPAQAT